jgi:hypothetical protein
MGLEPGAWESMQVDERRTLATHILDELVWVGDDQQKLKFSFA